MERPIILKAHEVRGILENRQTQLRCIIKPQPPLADYRFATCVETTGNQKQVGMHHWVRMAPENPAIPVDTGQPFFRCPYGQPGDRLWVREGWQKVEAYDGLGICYRADEKLLALEGVSEDENWCPRLAVPHREISDVADDDMPWRSPALMPRWASRILLEIVSVRVERVQDISPDDAKASGFLDGGCLTCGESSHPNPCGCTNPRPDHVDAFVWQWHQDHGDSGPDCWIADPWVWVVEFKRVTADE